MSSFAQSNVYPPMPLKVPAPFGGGIKSKAVTSSLSGEGSSLKAGSFWWWVRCLFQNKRIRRFNFESLKGESEFVTFPEIKTEHVSGEGLVRFPCHLQGKTGKKTVIEDVEDDVDELPDLYLA